MTTHMWGDSDFDWKSLYDAMHFIEDEAEKIGIYPCMKEKYGTIRYELLFMWNRTADQLPHEGTYPTDKQQEQFQEILRKAIKKYPTVACEILEDWIPMLDFRTMPEWMREYDTWTHSTTDGAGNFEYYRYNSDTKEFELVDD